MLMFGAMTMMRAVDQQSPSDLATATRIDLEGNPLLTPPNPIVPRSGDTPAITVFSKPNLIIQRTTSKPSKGTILIFPGGGYHVLSVTREGTAAADRLNEDGYDTAVLEYSINTPDARAKALADATRSVKLLQEKGASLGLNTASLGLMGFSAGAHLATRVLHEMGATTPFVQIILIYPAYLDEKESPSVEIAPPQGIHTKVFVAIGAKDRPEWVSSASAYADASKANGQQTEYHLLLDTGHGFGMELGQSGAAGTLPNLVEVFLKKE